MEKLYNLEYLEEISGGDKDFIADMLKDFINNAPVSMGEVETSVNRRDWQQVYAVVHRFIPSFEFVGAEPIRSKLRQIESCAKSLSNVQEIPGLLNEAKKDLDQVILSIKNDFKF